MTWEDRLRLGRYTSPSGQVYEFEFFELVRQSGKKAPTQNLFGTNDNDTQDLGNAITELPIQIFFSGADYDLIADRFWESLSERGFALLEHPRWGNLSVLPVSRSQKEDFSEEARRAIFNVKFKIIEEKVTPVSSTQTEGEVLVKLDEYQESGVTQFSENIDTQNLESENEVKAYFSGINELINTAIKPLVEGSEELLSQFNIFFDNIENNIDDLLDDPISLAENYIRLLRLPSRAATSIGLKLSGYRAIIESLFSELSPLNNQSVTLTSLDNRNRANQQELISFAIIAAAVESAISATYSRDLLSVFPVITNTDQLDDTSMVVFTKSQVFDIIEQLNLIIDTTTNALDDSQSQFSDLNLENQYQYSSESYEALLNSLTLTIQVLTNRAFPLTIEETIVLDSQRTPLEVTFQFYGSIDFLDFFLSSNKIGDNDIFLLPSGREYLIYG